MRTGESRSRSGTSPDNHSFPGLNSISPCFVPRLSLPFNLNPSVDNFGQSIFLVKFWIVFRIGTAGSVAWSREGKHEDESREQKDEQYFQKKRAMHFGFEGLKEGWSPGMEDLDHHIE
jgi:hypothetical protein